MHELSLARDLFEIVGRKAKEARFSKVCKIKIILGQASGVEEELLRHSLIDHLIPETIAQGAELEIQIQPLKAKCQGCGSLNLPILKNLACPDCGGLEIDIIEGKDVYVESIEGEQ